MTDEPKVEPAFVRVLFDDNQRLRQELVQLRHEHELAVREARVAAAEAEREMMWIVRCAGGDVRNIDGPSHEISPRLHRVYDGLTDRVVAWVIKDDASEQHKAA